MTGPAVVAGVLGLGLGTLLMKAAGPVLVAGRHRTSGRLDAVGVVLPTALLSALVATDVLGAGPPEPARLAGVVVAGGLVALRAPFALVVLVGSATTAVVRLLAP